MLGTVLNATMSHEAQKQCGAGYNMKSEGRTNSRNGYRDRSVKTVCGQVDVRVPKLRTGVYDPSAVIEKFCRVDRAVVCMVAEMYASGVSTRAVANIARQFGIDKMPASTVSDMCSELDKRVEEFRSREIGRTPFLWVDGTPLKCQVDGRYRQVMVVTAIGVAEDGRRTFLDAAQVDVESFESWSSFLYRLRERGLSGVKLVVSDAHPGLVKAIERHFGPGCTWQRCVFHFQQNMSDAVGTRSRKCKLAHSLVGAAVHQPTEMDAHAVWREAARALAEFSTDGADLMDRAEHDVLAFMAFPKKAWPSLRTNNVQERMNAEIKRRTKKIGAFPSVSSMMRLVTCVMLQCNDRWDLGRRHYTQPVMEAAFAGPAAPEQADPEREEACILHAKAVVREIVDRWKAEK
jgi:transposase-like protein